MHFYIAYFWTIYQGFLSFFFMLLYTKGLKSRPDHGLKDKPKHVA